MAYHNAEILQIVPLITGDISEISSYVHKLCTFTSRDRFYMLIQDKKKKLSPIGLSNEFSSVSSDFAMDKYRFSTTSPLLTNNFTESLLATSILQLTCILKKPARFDNL